jgi:electron transport complex protein RnfG
MSGHSDQDTSILKVALNLTVACFISGLIIATVYFFTADAAAEKIIELRNEAMRELVADADEFTVLESNEEIFEAIKGGKTVAYIIPAEQPGYEGTLHVLVAVGIDGKVIDYKITAHKETPGLGDKAANEPFRKQFWGKTKDQLEVVKDPSKTDKIQALTGATITSKAVTEAVKKALDEATHLKGGE